MDNKDIINQMLTYCHKIHAYCAGLDEWQFCSSPMVADACVLNLIQLGELAVKFEPGFIDSNPQIPWKEIKGSRNKFVHNYEDINFELVWEIIQTDLPDLIGKLNELLQGNQP